MAQVLILHSERDQHRENQRWTRFPLFWIKKFNACFLLPLQKKPCKKTLFMLSIKHSLKCTPAVPLPWNAVFNPPLLLHNYNAACGLPDSSWGGKKMTVKLICDNKTSLLVKYWFPTNEGTERNFFVSPEDHKCYIPWHVRGVL